MSGRSTYDPELYGLPRMPTVREVSNAISKGFHSIGYGSPALAEVRANAPAKLMNSPADATAMRRLAAIENQAAKTLPRSDNVHLISPKVRTISATALGFGVSVSHKMLEEAHPDKH